MTTSNIERFQREFALSEAARLGGSAKNVVSAAEAYYEFLTGKTEAKEGPVVYNESEVNSRLVKLPYLTVISVGNPDDKRFAIRTEVGSFKYVNESGYVEHADLRDGWDVLSLGPDV